MAQDPKLREQLELAERLRISPKRLRGWEPATIHEYDSEGLLVSSTPESEWDETEAGWLIALDHWRRENICPVCGGEKAVCQAPDGEFVYGAEDPSRCKITTAIRKAQAPYDKAPVPDALVFRPTVKPWGS